MNILLVVVLVYLVVSAVIGKKRGFIKTVFSTFSMIVALILTAIFTPIVAKQLQSNEKLVTYFADKAEAALPFGTLEENLKTKEEQKNFLEDLPLPESIRQSLIDNNKAEYYTALGVDTVKAGVDAFKEYLCNSFAHMIIRAISFVGTFLVIFILLKVLCFSLNLISKLPLLNQANHLLGLAAGVLNALIVIWIFFIVITALAGTKFGSSMMSMVNDNGLLSFLYNNNLLLGRVVDLSKLLP